MCVRNEDGNTLLSQQVSTRPEKTEAFLQQLAEMDPEFMAILEVCGFNDWLIQELRDWNCSASQRDPLTTRSAPLCHGSNEQPALACSFGRIGTSRRPALIHALANECGS